METYLPIIQATLFDWYQLTLANPLYATTLAAAVFLLTAIVYGIRIGSLNRRNIANEKARIDMENALNAELDSARQEKEQMQEELTAATGQMEKAKQSAQKETERAAKHEELLNQRNKQVSAIIQTLATSFDLGERPVPVMGDIKAEGMWQQHDRVITLLSTRLRGEQQAKNELQHSYQAETAKRAEKEALIETLQTSLSAKAGEFSKLEQALDEQKTLLQQQQDAAQQVLSQTLEKHGAELARLAELEQQALELANVRQQLAQVEEKLAARESLIPPAKAPKPVEHVKVEPELAAMEQDDVIELKAPEEEITPAPLDPEQPRVIPVKEKTGGVAGKLKGLLGKTRQEPVAAEQETEIVETQAEEEIQPEPVAMEVEQPPASPVREQTGSVAGKLKGLFGKAKQEPLIAEPEAVETQREEENQPEPAVEQSPESPAKNPLGKLKNLFGSKQQVEEIQEEPAPMVEEQPLVNEAKSPLAKLKNLLTSKQKAEEIQEEIQPMEPEQEPVSAAKSPIGKLKSLLGSKPKAEEIQEEPAPVVEEQPPVSTVKSPFGKLKNVFGKSQ